MKFLPWFALLFHAALPLHAQPKASPDVEILSESGFLQPSSTLEFRFSRPMISPEEIGVDAANSPVIIAPDSPGKFIWLSTRSGVFSPIDIPPLGTTFKLSTRAGLLDRDGKPIGKSFQATLQTPPFQVAPSIVAKKERETVEPKPEEPFAFNLNVKAEGADRYFEFVNDRGEHIPSTVRYATGEDYFRLGAGEGDWEERWRQSRKPTTKSDDDEATDDQRRQPLLDRIYVSPATPLTPGSKWRLELKPGLPSASGKYQISQAAIITLGQVEPFVLQKVTTSSYVNSGRSLSLEFSKDIAPDIKSETAGKYFQFEPAVANLRFEEGWQSLQIRGDFARGRTYKMTVDPSLLSSEALPLEGALIHTFTFEPVSPRIYLPAITGHQFLGGKRQFEVRSVNLAQLKITAHLVDPAGIPQAITAFEKYNKDWDENNPDEMYQAIPEGLITGRVIAEKTLDLTGDIDTPQTTFLDWAEILGAPKAGAIFLTVSGEPLAAVGGKKPAAQALMQVTDVGVLWKKVDQTVRVSLFSLTTGKPLPDVALSLLDKNYQGHSQQKSNAEGNAILPIPDGIEWLLARSADDAFAMRMGNEASELPMSGFRLPIYYGSWERTSAQPMRVLLFTDRPLYQPGEKIHLKGLVREIAPEGLRSAAARKGTVRLSNPRGDQVATLDITTDTQGAFDGELTLPAESTGRHSLRVEFENPDGRAFTAFEVANYQPNAFEITNSLPSRLSALDPVAAEISAKYFFGAALSKASVRWTLRQTASSFSPEGFTDFRFPEADEGQEKSLTLRGEGQLEKGRDMRITPRLPDPETTPSRGLLTVEVTDINQQTVSNTRVFTRDASRFYLGIAPPDSSVIRAGNSFETRVIAVRPDGQPMEKPVALEAKLIRQKFETVRVQGAGKAISFRTETVEEPVAEFTGETLLPTREGTDWKIRDGASFTCKPTQPGGYKLRVSATDSDGRKVVTDWKFYVSGPDEVVWDYRSAQQIDLVADRADYHRGDTARILVKSAIAGEALVSVERGEQVLRSWKTTLTGNASTIEVPIESLDAPNIFVSVMLIRGADQSTRKYHMPEYRYGVCLLNVADPATRLQVAVTPFHPEFQPGEDVETNISVRDGLDRPMPGADVTFFAVDDGILALTGYERPMPGEVFFAPLSLQVRTGLNIFKLMPEDPAALVFENKGYLIGGGGLEGPGTKLRSNFPGTAAWYPSLRTDDQGLLKVKFTAPDAITRYRLVAVAHARDKYFGSGESAFTIRKPLLLLPSLGQFANVDDEIMARAVVRNDSGTDGEAEVTLLLDEHAESSQPTVTRLALKTGESKPVDFPVKLTKMGSAKWKWSARMTQGAIVSEDYVQSTLTVGSSSVLLRETALFDLSNKTNDLRTGLNPQLLEGTGSVAVSISNTRLASLRESVSQLLDYPYGCAEQTVSALIPWLVIDTLRPVLPDLKATDERRAIPAGIAKLFSMQTGNGGIAYWPGGTRPSLFASAYAAVALSLAEKNGFTLPEKPWKQLLDYLAAELRGTDKLRTDDAFSDQALALYALAAAGKKQPAYHENLYLQRAVYSSETRALLALALLESKATKEAITDLLDLKTPAPESFSWFGGPARERAIQLLAWTQFQPKSNEVARLVKELQGLRHNGHWGNTQANAWALLALSRYYASVEAGAKNVSAKLVYNDKKIPIEVTKTAQVQNQIFEFNPTLAPAILSVENPKKGTLFGEARFVVRPPLGKQPRQDRGYAVSRSYQRIDNDGKIAEVTDWKVGDRVLVTLRIETSRPGHFVAIDDPLPAVFEAVNPSFQSQDIGGAENVQRDWMSDYREIRADRVLYFCDHLPAGTFQFRYLARVRSAGTVTAPATKVEEMYRPERFGLSETLQVASRAD